MIILNKKEDNFLRSDIFLNNEKGLHSFDTTPILVSEQKIQDSKSKLSNDSIGFVEIKLFTVVDKLKIIDGTINKIKVLLENESTSVNVENPAYVREKIIPEKNTSFAKRSSNFVSKKVKSYSTRSKRNIIEKKRIEREVKLLGYFNLNDHIDSGMVQKLRNKNLDKAKKFGSEKFYLVEKNNTQKSKNSLISKSKRKNANKINPNFLTSNDSLSEASKLELGKDDQTEIVERNKIRQELDRSTVFFENSFKPKGEERKEVDVIRGKFKKGQISSNNKFDKDFSGVADTLRLKYKKYIDEIAPKASSDYVIGEYDVSKQIDLISQTFMISSEKLSRISSDTLKICFKALGRNGRVISVYNQEVSLTSLRLQKNFPKFDFDVSAERSGRFTRVKISNNDANVLSFNVYKKNVSSRKERNFNTYQLAATCRVLPGQTYTYRDLTKNAGVKSQNFRVSPVFNGKEYSNFKSVSVESKAVSEKILKNSHFGISTKIEEDSIELVVQNVPSGVRKLTVEKRNLSKRQKEYSRVKTLSNRVNTPGGDASNIDNILLVNAPIVIISPDGNKSSQYVFYDDDVEDLEVYEYKIRYSNSNGQSFISESSTIEKFERKTGFIFVEGKISDRFSNSSSDSADNLTSKGRSLNFSGNIIPKKNEILQAFDSLDRNTFELYKDDLDQVRQSINKQYTVKAELVNKTESETIHLGEFPGVGEASSDPSTGRSFEIDFEIPESIQSENYSLKLTPLFTQTTDLITQINEKVKTLATKDAFSKENSFSSLSVVKNLSSLDTKSSVNSKFSSVDYRTKGRIVSVGSVGLGSEKGLSLIEKQSTGDVVYFDLGNNNIQDNDVTLVFDNLFLVHNSEKERRSRSSNVRGTLNFRLKEANVSSNIDFLILHSVSKNKTNNHGLLFSLGKSSSPSSTFSTSDSETSYLGYFELENAVGIYNFFITVVYSDGNISEPINICRLKTDSFKTEVI